MQSGLALADERVEELKALYSGLRGYFREALPFWMADLAAGGEAQSNHRASRFNTGIVSQMRGVLDDLARETSLLRASGGAAIGSVRSTSPSGCASDPGVSAARCWSAPMSSRSRTPLSSSAPSSSRSTAMSTSC